ncbi:hypothetical protein RF11_08907 [Thelohanellus kitauei]|uniref:Uncharacterized protein n=1 Tax=Thelohanellus kitauei TaxID=669202 RepID=A0A0C2JAV9_THEKT|nr:hypothetical protein RF11_08907 [Thelohanellus kitauei]
MSPNPGQRLVIYISQTVDGVLRTLDHLRGEKIDVCVKSSPMANFQDVAIPVAKSYLSDEELKEFFNSKHVASGHPFLDDLFHEMISRIRSGENPFNVTRYHMVDIVKKIVFQYQLAGEEIIDAFCHFQRASSVANKIPELVQTSYYALQPLVEKRPDGYFEFRKSRKSVNAVEAELVKSIKEIYSSEAFLGRPFLSNFISAVRNHEIDRLGELEYIIVRKIERTALSIEEDYRRPPLKSDMIIGEDNHLFERFAMAEWKFLDHKANERRLCYRVQITFTHVVLVSVTVTVFSLLCLALYLRKAPRASRFQKLAEDIQETEKLAIL